MVNKDKKVMYIPLTSKREVARRLLNLIMEEIGKAGSYQVTLITLI